MSSPLLTALAKLDHSVRILEGRLDCLGAGVDVSSEQFIQNVMEARLNVDIVCELIRARRPDVEWADRQSLEKLIRDLEAAEAGRKELRLTKLLELAEELNAGTITHRLKSRVTALEATRELAVRELLTEAANDEPKDLPGPQASAWMRWAFGLQDNAHAAEFSGLERDFPALVTFVCDMEESYWQPREAAPGVSEQVAGSQILSAPQPAIVKPPSPLSESVPSFAARYGHLSAAKAAHSDAPAPPVTAPVAAAQVAVAQAVETPVLAEVVFTPTLTAEQPSPVEALPQPRNGSAPEKVVAVEPPPQPPEPAPLEVKPIIFPPFSLDDEDSGAMERRGFRLNRSVLITLGAIAAIVLVMVVISAVSGSVSAKRSASPLAPVTAQSAKEAPATTPAAPVSDIELVGEIEQKLKVIPGSSIYVSVQHGTAVLEGQVPSEEALSQAEELTLQSSQIKVVRDRLQVAKAGVARPAPRPTTPSPAAAN